jgi:hypothetical protein
VTPRAGRPGRPRRGRMGPMLPLVLLVVLLGVAGCGGEEDDAAQPPPATGTGGGAGPTAGAGTGTDGGGDAAGVPVLTERDGNRTVSLRVGGEALIRLHPPVVWAPPLVSEPGIVELSPVEYFADPGFTEYAVRAVAPGTVVVSTSGSRGGGGRAERFEVAFEVAG